MLSIVIPAYNEEVRLGTTLERLRMELPTAEIVVVDDGSHDRTSEIAREGGARVIRYPLNRGKGFALRTGMMAAAGDPILFSDADLSTPIQEASRLEERLESGFHVAIGSRKLPGAQLLKRQPFFREILGKGFTLLSQLSLGVRVSDFTCGFKMFTRACARDLFARLTIDRWGFDCEILFLARRLGYRVVEVPVAWANDVQTRVNLARDVMQSFLDLVRIRLNTSCGRFGRRRDERV